MAGAAFLRLADVLAEPMVLVSGAGIIEAINRSGRAAFPDAAPGVTFSALFPDQGDRGARYLRECSRVSQPLPGGLVDASGRAWRMKGARYAGEDGIARVVLRLEDESPLTTRFAALNRQLEALRGEMRTRLHAETALRREREWLQVTLMSIGDAVIATDVEGRVVFMNPVARSLTGWPGDDAVGAPISKVFVIINESTRRPVDDPVHRVLRDGRAVGLANHTILVARDGSEWPIDDSASPIRDDDGRVVGVVLVFHQIVERRQLDRLQRQRIEDLEQESRRKDQFLAMLAHELRNPLAPLLTVAELLAGDPSPARVERMRGVVERQVRQLARLVDDLLDLSRITRGRIELRRETVDVAAVVEAAVAAIRSRAAEREQSIRVDVPADLPRIDADPVRLEQVLSNVLTNAVKYTPAGGQIAVAVRCDDWLSIVVRDSGVGIARELLPRIFDPFVQGDESLARSEGGLGIGLTLVKYLIELHGGNCSAESDGHGLGTAITVRLPLQRDQDTQAGAPAREREAASPTGLRVLVVDDLRDAAEVLAEVLTAMGCVVSTAHDGPSGLEKALVELPDVALLDIGLPGMDGYEVARRIRRAPRLSGCVLVAVTGYGQQADRERSAEAGFSAHLLKPIDPQMLRELLASLARR